jgi:dTDP-glucose pyrophosphorylase
MENFEKLIIDETITLLESLKIMDSISHKLLIVLNNNQISGLLSIGDVQRAIISGANINSKIIGFYKKEYIYADENETEESIRKKMLKSRLEFIPILSKSKQIKSIIFWDEIIEFKKKPIKKLTLPVVIMAGGLGSRLRPITNVLPKALLPFGNSTILESIIDYFNEYGLENFYISTNYKSKFIEFYFNDLDKKNYNIEIFKENFPLGTAGSLKLLENKIKNTFIVSNCDILIKQDLNDVYDFHISQKNDITIIASLKTYTIPYGTLKSGKNGQLINIEEKPKSTYLLNCGVYFLEPKIFNLIPNNTFFHITDLITKIKNQNGRIGIFPISEQSWQDIGEWDSYMKVLNQK